MTPEQRAKAIQAIQAGERAAAFYEEYPFEAARQAITDAWTKEEKYAAREDLWMELQALDRVVKMLRTAGQSAKAAAMEIKQSEQPEDRYAHP